MKAQITNDIKVSVEAKYEPLHSKPSGGKFLFSYHITIENLSEHVVQLLSRRWQIFDSAGVRREVKGEGVIGQQPILSPGQIHEYSSWCPLSTPVGKMRGIYTMIRRDNSVEFDVAIPEFALMAPAKLN